MIVVPSDRIEGRRVEKTLGLVSGSALRANWLGNDITSVLRHPEDSVIYEKTLDHALDKAKSSMIKEAQHMGADAVVGTKFSTAMISGHTAEVLVYGTAVKLK
jgi:uncharacterized protein YbjQ (UPF0145 family)